MTVVSLRNQRSSRPLLLDLFCGAGGAATGYYEAGFDVVGVDVDRQPRYPFPFIQDDALAFMEWMLAGNSNKSFDAIHASPPCQRYSTIVKVYRADRLHTFPDLVATIRASLLRTGLPFVIENVPGAPLDNPVTLCGSQFGLTSRWPGIGKVGLRRHRNFEAHGFTFPEPCPHDHSYKSVPVCGHMRHSGNNVYSGKGFRGESFGQLCKDVTGIDWMIKDELNEAIPPVYTKYIGGFLLDAVKTERMTIRDSGFFTQPAFT